MEYGTRCRVPCQCGPRPAAAAAQAADKLRALSVFCTIVFRHSAHCAAPSGASSFSRAVALAEAATLENFEVLRTREISPSCALAALDGNA